ncbi:ComEC/Rec2 family competence protein [Occallatibacter riparius]|uniref:Metallohydrolase n=1 Tax=Occallatibacter riparius TaxID=1002689 RepID=A0A9J7BRQ0_9BACT|nr:hypothetical protein [Occallatibacter riparius]UWZ85257.1 hypothetical protein MOP44_04775 [Occallatibacter riparius]
MGNNNDGFALPIQGYVQWPVGTGDSTTVCMAEDMVMQVDIHHLGLAEREGDPHVPIVDRLIEHLPKRGKRPYLAVFVLTHPDEDHCLGFQKLLANVEIGELWFSPRVFREYKKDLCDDALTFREEAVRRVRKTIQSNGDVSSGDRVRIIGYDDLLREDEYKQFPKGCFSVPGHEVVEFDGVDLSDRCRVFLHAPFKDSAEEERNDCSVAMQIRLDVEGAYSYLMLLADHCYPTVKRIFEVSNAEDVKWHILLAPHHCSKSVMYWKDPGNDSETLKQDVLDLIEGAAQNPGYIIASSEPIPGSNQSGDCPPHAKAKARYQEIAPTDFLCTHEHPGQDQPQPIVFEATNNGFVYLKPAARAKQSTTATLTSAVSAARGSSAPPSSRVGFGDK